MSFSLIMLDSIVLSFLKQRYLEAGLARPIAIEVELSDIVQAGMQMQRLRHHKGNNEQRQQ